MVYTVSNIMKIKLSLVRKSAILKDSPFLAQEIGGENSGSE